MVHSRVFLKSVSSNTKRTTILQCYLRSNKAIIVSKGPFTPSERVREREKDQRQNSNIKENFLFPFLFRSVWTGPNSSSFSIVAYFLILVHSFPHDGPWGILFMPYLLHIFFINHVANNVLPLTISYMCLYIYRKLRSMFYRLIALCKIYSVTDY